jgi:hypothetical protein
MKTIKTTLIIFVLSTFCSVAMAQTKPVLSAPLNLKFGMSFAEVKKAMIAKGFEVQTESPKMIMFKDVTIGNMKSAVAVFKFINNKLYQVNFGFFPPAEKMAQKIYDDLQEIIETKYGKGDYYRNFTGAYDDGDGFEMQAVRLGEGSIKSFWLEFADDSGISLAIEPLSTSVYVSLQYQDGILIKDAIAKQDEKNNTDF